MKLIDQYLDEMIHNNNSKQTYRKYLKVLFNHAVKNKGVTAYTVSSIPTKPEFSAIANEYKKDKAPKTYTTFLSVCKNFFSWAVEEDLIDKTPYKSSLELKKVENKNKKVWLTIDEMKKIREYSEKKLKAPQKLWVDLMMALVIRGIELTRLKVEDVQMINGVYCLAIQGKGKSDNNKDIRKLTSETLIQE